MLKKYQRPNSKPSTSVLFKPPDSAASPALSGTEVALTSNRLASLSPAPAEIHGLSLNDEDEVEGESDQDRRGRATLPRSRGAGEEEALAENRTEPRPARGGRSEARLDGLARESEEGEERAKAELCIAVIGRDERDLRIGRSG